MKTACLTSEEASALLDFVTYLYDAVGPAADDVFEGYESADLDSAFDKLRSTQ